MASLLFTYQIIVPNIPPTIATSFNIPLSFTCALWTWAIDAAAIGSLKLTIEDKPIKQPKKSKPKKTVKKAEPKITKDQNPPVIKIASTFNFSDTKNQIMGKVSDKDSKKIYVKYKDDYGQEKGVDVIDGKFTFVRYSPISEELLIIATDTSGNEIKKKIKQN